MTGHAASFTIRSIDRKACGSESCPTITIATSGRDSNVACPTSMSPICALDDVVAEPCHDRSYLRESIRPFVGDQDLESWLSIPSLIPSIVVPRKRITRSSQRAEPEGARY